jgi:hypothetical protein
MRWRGVPKRSVSIHLHGVLAAGQYIYTREEPPLPPKWAPTALGREIVVERGAASHVQRTRSAANPMSRQVHGMGGETKHSNKATGRTTRRRVDQCFRLHLIPEQLDGSWNTTTSIGACHFLKTPTRGSSCRGVSQVFVLPSLRETLRRPEGECQSPKECKSLGFSMIYPAQRGRGWVYSTSTPCSNKCLLRLSKIDRWGGWAFDGRIGPSRGPDQGRGGGPIRRCALAAVPVSGTNVGARLSCSVPAGSNGEASRERGEMSSVKCHGPGLKTPDYTAVEVGK